jgi:hypothetical protein
MLRPAVGDPTRSAVERSAKKKRKEKKKRETKNENERKLDRPRWGLRREVRKVTKNLAETKWIFRPGHLASRIVLRNVENEYVTHVETNENGEIGYVYGHYFGNDLSAAIADFAERTERLFASVGMIFGPIETGTAIDVRI